MYSYDYSIVGFMWVIDLVNLVPNIGFLRVSEIMNFSEKPLEWRAPAPWSSAPWMTCKHLISKSFKIINFVKKLSKMNHENL